jgi:hypothetical protein
VIDSALFPSINRKEYKMRRKQSLLGVMILLVSLLMISCGIPQTEYDTALAERDAAQAKVEALEIKVEALQIKADTLQDELDKAQERIESFENDPSKLISDLAAAHSQISALQSDLDEANINLAIAQDQIAKLEAIYKVVLLFDDFEDGNATGWDLEGNWSIVQEDDNYILRGAGLCSADIGLQEWTDYTLEARIKFSQSAIVNLRVTAGLGKYFLNIEPDGPSLYKKLSGETFLAKSSTSLQENEWIDFKVEAKRDGIELYINGQMVFRYTDSQPLLSGSIGFEAPVNSVVYIDDVMVMVAK